MYPIALILNASVTYFKDITDRFLVPVYLPVFLTGLLGIELLMRLLLVRLARPIALTGCMVALAVLPVMTNWNGMAETSHLIAASRSEGVEPDNLYINRDWQTNEALDVVRTLAKTQRQAVFYSNRPAGVALYTWHTVFWSPAKFDPVFESHTYALGSYASAFQQCSSQCYLVWMLPHPYVHLYPPSQLSRIVRLEKVYYSPTGIVYRILPSG
jgi:hypothetical protein